MNHHNYTDPIPVPKTCFKNQFLLKSMTSLIHAYVQHSVSTYL